MKTYEAERIYKQGTDSMCEHAEAEYVDVRCGHDKIPEKIAGSKSLDHGGGTSIAPDTLLPVHVLTLVIDKHNP